MKQDFGKNYRIKSDKEFEGVLKKGERISGKKLVIFRRKSEGGLKFGIRVNRAVKGAKRNRVKRILREIFRKNKDKFDPNEKVVVLYSSDDQDVDYKGLLDEFCSLLR